MKLPIVMIGMSASGKTTIGKILATKLALDFYDSDVIIENILGKDINKIFLEDGEEKFRKIEKETVLRLIGEMNNCVISIGAGAILSQEIQDIIKNKSFSIWLQVDKEVLYTRLLNQKDRPLFLNKINLREKISDIIAKRDVIYSTICDIIVKCEPKDSVFDIIERINLK